MVLLCTDHHETSYLETIAKIAEVVIALANLFLAIYIIHYQIQEQEENRKCYSSVARKNIKLQWFKELIVQPNMAAESITFYENLHTIRGLVNLNDLTINVKEDINNFVKSELRNSENLSSMYLH